MLFGTIAATVGLAVSLAVLAGFIYLMLLLFRALKKYIGSSDERGKASDIGTSLGEAIKAHRARCKMTQEFVAEALGVTRQAVSKWENGSADPSTSNLIALAKLFGVSVDELLREVR